MTTSKTTKQTESFFRQLEKEMSNQFYLYLDCPSESFFGMQQRVLSLFFSSRIPFPFYYENSVSVGGRKGRKEEEEEEVIRLIAIEISSNGW